MVFIIYHCSTMLAHHTGGMVYIKRRGCSMINCVLEKTGSPSSDYTNDQWQRDFAKLRSRIISSVVNTPDDSNNDQIYHDFIDGILFNLRRGNIDYCFYIYQVADLLKYEPYRLHALWLNKERCFRLSL